MGKQLAYTSVLDRTRTVIHELVHVKRYGPITQCVTSTGLEFVLDDRGNVQLVAGGNKRRTEPPEPWEIRTPHLIGQRPIRCGIGGVVS